MTFRELVEASKMKLRPQLKMIKKKIEIETNKLNVIHNTNATRHNMIDSPRYTVEQKALFQHEIDESLLEINNILTKIDRYQHEYAVVSVSR